MKGKTFIIFLSGALVALVISGIIQRIQGPSNMDMSHMDMPMDGMEMGGMAMDKAGDQRAVHISSARRQLIGVKTEPVKERALTTRIRTVGTADYDERKVRQVNMRVSGWITKLFADYTGTFVRQGDPILTLYSPDLVATQEEYLLAKKTFGHVMGDAATPLQTSAAAQVKSAHDRLLLWNMTETQIAQLEKRGTPQTEITLNSPISGVVTKKMALSGMYVTPEMNLYEIADLSTLWIHADIYEYEIPLVQVGQEAAVTLAAYPGETFTGRVIYIYPYLNAETRTVKVRMEFPNPDRKIKPGMYGNVEIQTDAGAKLAIPQEAVLDSGTRKLVFVERGEGIYEPREVKLANKVDHFYPILEGLQAGEPVVTSATFLIDSESQLMAATNMMGLLGMGGIQMEQAKMGEMEMGDMSNMKGMEGMTMDQHPEPREKTVDGLTIALATDPDPAKVGGNVIRLTVRSDKGAVTDANVTFAYTMAMPGMEVETVQAKPAGKGIYEATANLGMRGAWEVEAIIARGFGKPVRAKFTVSVGKP